MRKVFFILFAFGILGTSLTSCREKSTVEKIADDVEDAID
ncbi:hypothetical protein BXY75_2611 [Ulvibacter antarcticus]|uniref:Entericidin EcnA/B family protein n=1 Tax=Ulvibacter antarcticus TaxID=442714 RepID=A0A3L9YI27_9FLAO|nr:hypothetical protein BXY75_2611 [Ulvibacter antarcticus]